MKQAKRKFLALKVASLSSKPGLCGSMALVGSRLARMFWIPGSTGTTMWIGEWPRFTCPGPTRTGKHLQQLRACVGHEVRNPEKSETKYYHNGVETGSSGKQLRWFNGDQYMEGGEIERAITIGSRTLDAEIAKQEGL